MSSLLSSNMHIYKRHYKHIFWTLRIIWIFIKISFFPQLILFYFFKENGVMYFNLFLQNSSSDKFLTTSVAVYSAMYSADKMFLSQNMYISGR